MNPGPTQCYRVFAGPGYAGNPVTLHERDDLGADAALLHAARVSPTEDNVFYCHRGSHLEARFFSTRAELLLCGHGLLALAGHLGQQVNGTVEVQTPAGTLALSRDGGRAWAVLPAFAARRLASGTDALGTALTDAGYSLQALYAGENGVYIMQVDSLEALLGLDASRIAGLDLPTVPGALIAVLQQSATAYGLRYFAPWHGKPEDSGTGSAQCYLAPLLLSAAGCGNVTQYSPAGEAKMQVRVEDGKVCISGQVIRMQGSE